MDRGACGLSNTAWQCPATGFRHELLVLAPVEDEGGVVNGRRIVDAQPDRIDAALRRAKRGIGARPLVASEKNAGTRNWRALCKVNAKFARSQLQSSPTPIDAEA
jgi:hypothetical protein